MTAVRVDQVGERRPNHPDVRFTGMVTVSLGGTGTIRHVVDNTGGPSDARSDVADLKSHP
ncbi:hypothetical protein JK361_00345 [Streptomyces sp. 5-8]|uniref:Uncharacterized protein n=1 Tax=Streptomyces musisoli TaxID=2802280 RepID=A0ABS1NTK8_9ACTN|nr:MULTISPECIES: hypothetical protein [Streptomyces]MBL1103076.1 hypothetical protein [Streptomyces musisoli]MBY8840942.1 hypothetical protein [Streptomyces sp. SP2-10]